ncbi:sarcosine oxidase subunit alpha family protein [Gemmobacter sp.]|uniref:sarcosine oxidase subunit alpha family protein n=1 Tax=Gemmobacter sp. TaxID=1898957 RepID=UPI002AFF51EB|nr:sarcosine oxidase subunit alpha family protein [Gemmobacter sp.]
MTTRLATGGRLIDRSAPCDFSFDGTRLRGYQGDTLASALLANGRLLMGRSFKYHRPRGPVASGVEEPNALVNLGSGARAEPNVRATTTELFDGLEATSQNRWPSLAFDLGAVNDALARFLPAGFYYKTFMFPRAFWKHVFEPVIRQSAGLGRPPRDRDADHYEQIHAFCDVLVAGGGVAGLAAALAAARAGARVMVLEQAPHWGGRAPVDGGTIDGKSPGDWVKDALQALESMANVTLRSRCMVAGVHDHGHVLAEERVADHTPGDGRPRRRLWRIRAGKVIAATGALERPLSFAGNDLPGVMLAGAVRDYLVNWGVSPGDRTVLLTNNDDGYRTAIALIEAGLAVPAVLDARDHASGALPQQARAMGIRVETGKGLAGVKGRQRVTGVQVCLQAGEGAVLEEIACEAVAMSGGWSPVVHLWSHCGGKLIWDEAAAMFRPDPARPPTGADGAAMVVCAGAAAGALGLEDCLADAHAAAGGLGAAPVGTAGDEAPMEPVWIMPQGAPIALRGKMWLDFQNDVKVSDIQLAAREGFTSVEHAKRYTTLGMATDQGKLGNINGLAVLSEALDEAVPQVGTTTFRPPYAPVTFGALAGEARGALFQPVRRTPLHDWHEALGAEWEPVGLWRRPHAYPRAGETTEAAIRREVLAVRRKVGLLDASTLGKLLVKGPDAGRFLDMIYSGMMSNLGVGRCRYGLMLNEQGFVMDDGVVARLSADSWLCHSTSGGADRIHAWMEDWAQCEWPDWQLFILNLTEQHGQIAVAGPNARDLVQGLTAMDLSAAALPFMSWADGAVAGIPARVYRISFSGELGYELAVPAGQTRALWDRLVAAGATFGAEAYGTGALHVLRAEKGFIIVGDETDGTVTPQDLNMGWAVSRAKADFIGKRGLERVALTDPDRWRLVGLETLDGSVLPDGAYAVADGVNANGQRNVQGRVTSAYHSPTLGRGIALGLVRRGPDRLGEVLEFPTIGGSVQARIVDPVVYDKEGARNV